MSATLCIKCIEGFLHFSTSVKMVTGGGLIGGGFIRVGGDRVENVKLFKNFVFFPSL